MNEKLQQVVERATSSPCLFCGYNGEGFWQPLTHARNCPWHGVGGKDEREQKLASRLRETMTSRVFSVR